MREVDAGDLPSDKGSTKFFLISNHIAGKLPFKVLPLKILTQNGQRLVEDFRDSKGEFLGGGVFKSDDLEAQAREKPQCREIYLSTQIRLSMLPKSEQLRLSTQITSEWIAFEYALVFSLTAYGLIISIAWDHVDQIDISRKGFFGQSMARIVYRDKKEQVEFLRIQSNSMNLENLIAIAKACGVNTNQ